MIIFLRPPFPSHPCSPYLPLRSKSRGILLLFAICERRRKNEVEGISSSSDRTSPLSAEWKGERRRARRERKKTISQKEQKNNSREEGRLWWSSPPCSHRSNIVIIVVALPLFLRLGMGIEGGNSPNRYALMVSLPNRSDSIAGFSCFSLLLLH